MTSEWDTKLTPNSMMLIIQDDAAPIQPIVQVLGFKKIVNNDPSKPDRWRLQISDGTNKQPSAMLGTQLNYLVTEDKIQKNGIIRLEKYLFNIISGRRIVIILNADVLAGDIGHIIGNPVVMREEEPVGESPSAAAAAAAAAAAPAAAAAAAASPAPAAAAAAAPASAAPKMTSPLLENKYKRTSLPSAAPAAASAPVRGSAAASLNNAQPISSLNPYNKRWVICVRITNKSPIRQWTNPKSSGKLFSVDMIDDSAELRGTAFNAVVDKLYPLFEVGKTYLIRGGSVKQANKKFSHIKNDYELSFEDSTEVDPVQDVGLPAFKFEFVPFSKFETIDVSANPNNTVVDVIGICTNVGTKSTIRAKTSGKELTKRDITIMDRDGISVSMTLWDKEAENFEDNGGSVGAVLIGKNIKLSDFSGRSLSCSGSSTFLINPDLPEAHEIAGWYSNEGQTVEEKKLTMRTQGGPAERIFISQIKDQQIGSSDSKADFFTIKGTVTMIKKDKSMYKGCIKCNRKLIETNNSYSCVKCNTSTTEYQWRMMMTVCVSDPTGQQWITCFQETAEQLIGEKANDLGHLMDTNDSAFQAKLSNAHFKTWMMKCRAKTERYQDDARVKVNMSGIEPINYKEESKYMLNEINKMLAASA